MMSISNTVLIVDDEPDMCWALENLLHSRGFACKAVQTGMSALAELQTYSFRIALLDAKLRDMDGLELAKQMKALAPTISIVMISGYYYKHDLDIQTAMEDGVVSGFIAKPFRHDDVIGIIESL